MEQRFNPKGKVTVGAQYHLIGIVLDSVTLFWSKAAGLKEAFVCLTADSADKTKAKADDKKQPDKSKKPAETSTSKSTTATKTPAKTPAKSSTKPTPKQQKSGQSVGSFLYKCDFLCFLVVCFVL